MLSLVPMPRRLFMHGKSGTARLAANSSRDKARRSPRSRTVEPQDPQVAVSLVSSWAGRRFPLPHKLHVNWIESSPDGWRPADSWLVCAIVSSLSGCNRARDLVALLF